MGDVVLTAPVFNNIKASLPHAEVVLLTREKYASFFTHHPSVDRIIALGRGMSFWHIIRMIRREQFDVMLDLHRSIRSRIVALAGGFKRVIPYKKDSLARRMAVLFHKSSPRLQTHTVEKYLEPLSRLDIPVVSKKLSFFSDKKIPIDWKKDHVTLLVMQTAFVGDSVLTIPLLETIQRNISCRLIVCTTPDGQDILQNSGVADEVIVFDKKGADRGFLSFIRLVRTLRSRRITVAIVPHRSFRSALATYLAKIPYRVGFSNSEGKLFLNHIVPFNWHDHDVIRNLSLLFPLGIQTDRVEWGLKVDDRMKAYADEVIRKQGWDSRILVGIHPGSIWPTKRWLGERFAHVADRLFAEWNAGIIIFGSEGDKASAEEVMLHARCSMLNMCGKTDLKQLSALTGRCALFITNDSGPMHIAVAMGVPTLALFGPTTRDLGFFPYGDMHRVMEVELSCRPCGLHGGKRCPKKHFDCMKRITAEEVLKNAGEMLKARHRGTK